MHGNDDCRYILDEPAKNRELIAATASKASGCQRICYCVFLSKTIDGDLREIE